MTPVDTPALVTSREWTGLAVIALPCAVCAMDLTVLNLALPVISADLRPSGSELLWIIDIDGFLVAGFLITMGTLGDCIGRRKLAAPRERGRITLATGLGNHGEPARIERDRRGSPSAFWLAGMKLLPEAKAAKELTARYARR